MFILQLLEDFISKALDLLDKLDQIKRELGGSELSEALEGNKKHNV